MASNLIINIPLRQHIKNILRVTKYVKKMEKWYFAVVFCFHFCEVILRYLALILSATVLNMISNRKSAKEIILVTIGFLAAYLVLQIIEGFFQTKNEVIKDSISRKYEFMITQKMMEMDYSLVESPRVQSIRKRMEMDRNYGSGIYEYFWHVDGVFAMILSIIGGIFIVIPILHEILLQKAITGILMLIAQGIIAIFLIRYQLKKDVVYEEKLLNEPYDTEQERADKCGIVWPMAMEEQYNYKNGKDVRIYDGYDLFKKYTYEKLDKHDREMSSEIAKLGATQTSIKEGIFNGMFGSGYFIVGFIAMGGKTLVGNLVQYAGALQQIFDSATRLIYIFEGLAIGSKKQLSTLELFELEDEMYKGKLPIEKRSDDEYEIEFENVSFQYPGAEEYALKDFSLKMKIGEKMAIVGMNGSGKTTMIKLLCKLYEPTEGRILLNGVDIRKFREDEYRKLFSVVFQDFKLLELELGENVAASKDYDKDKVMECLKKSGFNLDKEKMPKELDTFLYKSYDDSGVEISGGEAQKIAIARALYKPSSFILLDEPTSALDPLAENEIYAGFDAMVGTKTAIYISHRLSSCKFCNDIVVFDKGRMIQRGNHEELLKDTAGKYYEMWNAQAKYYQS